MKRNTKGKVFVSSAPWFLQLI